MSERSRKATAALVLGWIGAITAVVGVGLIFAIAAMLLGRATIKEFDETGGSTTEADRAWLAYSLGKFGAVLGVVAILFAGILIPALGTARRAGCKMKNGTQLTAIAKNMTLWSDQFYQQTQDFPRVGLDPDPKTFGYLRGIPTNSPEDRMAALVNMGTDLLSVQMLINPVGTDVQVQGPQSVPDIVPKADNLSYAALDALNKEWTNKINSSAPLLADKQVRKGSYYNTKNWEGDVVWGDTHVSWESGQNANSWPTTTITGYTNAHDDLFKGSTGPGATDAVLINP